jgi:hypothetical protein
MEINRKEKEFKEAEKKQK